MDIKSKFTNLLGAKIYLDSKEIELITKALQTIEEVAESDYHDALEEYKKADDEDYYMVEQTEKHLQEIRTLLISFEQLLQCNQ